MQTELTDKWLWPHNLDALQASPEHHRLLFENDKVRVIDTLIPPGEITRLHTHKWPASLYVKSWSDFIRRNEAGEVVLDSRTIDKKFLPGMALWSEPLAPHTLQNIGVEDLHIISVEIKSK